MISEKKILSYSTAFQISKLLKEDNKVIGLCHGCFDLLHIGHIRHFNTASANCDYLFVSVTPDEFVNKGPNRPVISQFDRMSMISQLDIVDFVLLNNFDSALMLLNNLLPNKFFKGVEYREKPEQINPNFLIERDLLIKNGGEMMFTNDEIRSTSQIIIKINLK